MIDYYLADVEHALRALRPLIVHETLTIERPEGIELAYLKGRITFLDGSQLAIAELISPSEKTYRFHYMDKHQHLLLRWDTAPHHRRIKTFPFHLHTEAGVSNRHR